MRSVRVRVPKLPKKGKGNILGFLDRFIDKDNDLPFPTENLFRNMAIGFLAGSIIAIGGAVKDSPYEGFKPLTFVRSPIIAALECGLLGILIPNAHWFLLFLGVIGIERITIEGYKLFRNKAPGKFEHGEWGRHKELYEANYVAVPQRRTEELIEEKSISLADTNLPELPNYL